MTCSDSVTGTNVNFPNFADGGRGGGAVQYLVAVDGPTYLAATTCSPSTSFPTRVRLFDASPTLGNASLLADSYGDLNRCGTERERERGGGGTRGRTLA